MSESSREFWRSPRQYARTEKELWNGEPNRYAIKETLEISEWLHDTFRKAGIPEEYSFLEVGCNCGRNIWYLNDNGYSNVVGVEINPEAKEFSRQAFPEISNKIGVSDAQTFLANCADDRYDVIYTQSVLMHIPPEDGYLFKQMARVARCYIVTNEVESEVEGVVERHKFQRNYKEVFEAFAGWEQVWDGRHARATTRMFKKT